MRSVTVASVLSVYPDKVLLTHGEARGAGLVAHDACKRAAAAAEPLHHHILQAIGTQQKMWEVVRCFRGGEPVPHIIVAGRSATGTSRL